MVKHRYEIELRHLRYFLASAEHGSFRRAGIALDVQESAVSRRIRDLEDRLGASLFSRHSGGVRLTVAGERFLDRAHAAICDIEAGAQDVAAIGRVDSGRVRIGVTAGAISTSLLDLLRGYDTAHSGVSIDLVAGETAEQVSAVRRRDIDVAIIAGSGNWNGCETIPLWTEPVFVALPDNHPLVSLPELRWHQLADECFIGDPATRIGLDQVSESRLLPETAKLVASSWSPRRRYAYMPLVALGRGVMLTCATKLVPSFPGVVYRPIVGEMLPVSAIWLAENDNPALRRLLTLARRQYHNPRRR